MGLAGRREKQRIGPDPRGHSWVSNKDSYGHRMLAQMGWDAGSGRGLGLEGTGTSKHIAVAFKQDFKGVGSQRREKELRESGKAGPEAWLGNSDAFGALLAKLNAVAPAAPEPVESVNMDGLSPSTMTPPTEGVPTDNAARKRKRADGADGKKEKKKSKKDKKAEKAEGKVDDEAAGVVNSQAIDVPHLSPTETNSTVVAENVPTAPKPVRLAHRAKFLAAKRLVGVNMLSVNEILGISASTSGTSSPATLSSTPAPMSPPAAKVTTPAEPPKEETKAERKERKAREKAERKAARKLEEKRKKDKGKLARQDARNEEDDESSSTTTNDEEPTATKLEPISTAPASSSQQGTPAGTTLSTSLTTPGPDPATTTSTNDGAEDRVQIANNSAGLSVQEYLSRKLAARKAAVAIAKAKREGRTGPVTVESAATAHTRSGREKKGEGKKTVWVVGEEEEQEEQGEKDLRKDEEGRDVAVGAAGPAVALKGSADAKLATEAEEKKEKKRKKKREAGEREEERQDGKKREKDKKKKRRRDGDTDVEVDDGGSRPKKEEEKRKKLGKEGEKSDE